MSTPVEESIIPLHLRSEAEARLKALTVLGMDALLLLHKLSSDPQTAADALKLLHELQVHQVELDLQREEMQVNEHCLSDELARYQELYEFAPIGYFLVDFQGEIIESNRAGAALFGAERDALAGDRIDSFLAVESRSVLLRLLEKLGEGSATLACEVTVDDKAKANASRPLRVLAKVSPDKCCVFLTLCECT